MAKTKGKIIIAFLLTIIMLVTILQIKSLAADPENSNKIIIQDNNGEYLIYIDGLLNEKFEFAFGSNADDLNYIDSIVDNEGNNIAFVDSELKAQYFNVENTYIWVRNENGTLISGEEINLNDIKTAENIKKIENLTKNITVESGAEDEKIKINGKEGEDYYYKFFVAGTSEEYNEFINLVNQISKFDENTDMFTKLNSYLKLEEIYSKIVPNVEDSNWSKAENQEIAKPYGAKDNEQYVLWLKDSNGNIDVQVLTAYEKQVTLTETVQKTEEVVVSLPVTYDNLTGLFIALGAVILAIVFIIAFKIISKKRRV